MGTAALNAMKPESAVIVYVDYVTGLDNLITTIPGPQFRNNVKAFASFSGLFGMPTVVFGEENDYYGTFFPEIQSLIDGGASTFPRSTPSGCTPDFMTWLEGTGRKDVVIGGISIDNCTLHTALDLLRAGYNVQVVADASGSNSPLAEALAIARLQAAGAVVSGWLNTLTELGADFAGPFGAGMMQIIQTYWPKSTVGSLRDTTPDGHGMQLRD